MTALHKLKALIVAIHLAALCGLFLFWEPRWLALSVVSFIAFVWFGHDLYYHRYLSHRAFEMPVWMQRVCMVLGLFCAFGSPIGVAAVHVKHHAYADTEDDPHPAHHAFAAWFWTHPAFDAALDIPTAKRLMRDRWLLFVSQHYFAIYLSTVSVAAMINIKLAVYCFFVPAAYAFFANGIVNVMCHRWGYRRHETKDNSRNNHLANALLLFSGIAMHNNHHARPTCPVMSSAWYEIDLVGCMAHAIHKLTNKTS